MEEHVVYLQSCMYQYSRAIYRSIKDLIDPYTDQSTRLESRRSVLEECELTMSRLAADPQYFARPDRALFQDIRRYFPITAQAQVAWAVREGVGAAIAFIEQQIEAGAFDGGIARCKATTRKGKACQRTPLPSRDYCPSHQHLEARAPSPRQHHAAPSATHRRHAQRGRPPLGASACRRLSGKLENTNVARHRQAHPSTHAVAFLMAERRPLTVRDVKGNVEGYSEMSDEAFARRFYSDRAELTGLGVPLHSQRDEFTGRGCYTLRSRTTSSIGSTSRTTNSRPPDGALLPRRQVRVCRAARLALQNLALGRPGRARTRTETAERVRVAAPDSPMTPGRLSKLESAISKQRTIKFSYWSPQRDGAGRTHPEPLCAAAGPRASRASWAPISTARPFAPSASRGSAATSASRRGASATSGSRRSSTSRPIAFRAPGRSARPWERHRSRFRATPLMVHRTLSDAGVLEDGVFTTSFARIEPLIGRVLRQNGRAVPTGPESASRRRRRRSRAAARRARRRQPGPCARAQGHDLRRPGRPSAGCDRSRRNASASCGTARPRAIGLRRRSGTPS